MAALMSLSQITSGNPAYENYYRKVDPGNTGRVGALEAAQFLKTSGLSDSTLGKIWDLSDPDRKGYLDKRGFFIALRLVASAQSGNDVSQSSLSQTASIPPPKFRDTASPSLGKPVASSDSSWAVRSDEKAKFDGIFESLTPVNGLLSGDKVKPVLINSGLPLDVLGKIWEISDVDKDGHLDKEEFAVAMHLVYRAREKEATPATLPPSLIPPSKRKKSAVSLPGSVAVLPPSPFLLKETLRPTASLTGKSALASATNLSPQNSLRSTTMVQPSSASVTWVVPLADRGQYEEIFELADSDFDGRVGGGEVKDIFINSGLPQNVLARIWSLADTKQTGKLTKEQFCLAMHLIHEKVKGIDPPQTLTPDMVPPSERGSPAPSSLVSQFSASAGLDLSPLFSTRRGSSSSVGSAGPIELTGNKDLDDIIQEISQLQSEKSALEREIRQQEDTLRQKSSELQSMQGELERENSGVQELEAQRRGAQDRLLDMEQQRTKLEDMLKEAKHKCQDESSKLSTLQAQIHTQEADMQSQEKELSRTKTDLYCMEEEERQLEESLKAGNAKLESILKLLRTSQDEMDQARSKLSQIQDSQQELNRTIERYNKALSGSPTDLTQLEELTRDDGAGLHTAATEDSFKAKVAMFSNSSTALNSDPFQRDDPFQSDPFNKADPFGGDPFKESDPFKDSFLSDPFGNTASSSLKPISFGKRGSISSSPKPKDTDLFGTSDPFASDSLGGKSGFADFGQMSKGSPGEAIGRRPTYPLPPPKKPGPTKPTPPPYGTHIPGTQPCGHPLGASPVRAAFEDRGSRPLSSSSKGPSSGHTDFRAFGSELQQLEWAKRQSERDEAERLRRLQLQEQVDLELAMALSRADMPRT